MRGWWVAGLLVAAASRAPAAEAQYPVTADLGGPVSVYTPLIVQLLAQWPPKQVDYAALPADRVRMRCFTTPEREFHIGLEQVMRVATPMERVAEVLDDFDRYTDLFTEFADIHVVSRDGNRVVTFWEHIVPFPLIPNAKYQMSYLIDRSAANRRVYRYQLVKKTGDMNSADGLIVLERDGAAATRYTEFDFWDGEYGIAKTLAPKKIWRDSVKETFLCDVSIKLRAEHADWPKKKLEEESKKVLDDKEIDSCLDRRQKFFLLTESSPSPRAPEVGAAKPR